MSSVHLSDDSGPQFAARAYPGCFTVDEVRCRLEPGADATTARQRPPNLEIGQASEVTRDTHFLPDCICAPLHVRCTGSTSTTPEPEFVNVTVDHLRYYSQRGCWFCSIVLGGIAAAPPWDLKREEEIPPFPYFRMPAAEKKHSRPDFSIDVFGDSKRGFEPRLVYYVDEAEGDDIKSSTFITCKLFHVRKEPDRTNPHTQLAFAARHLRECQDNHACVPPTPPTMPTRLLHVQVTDVKYAVQLVTDISPRPYVTLSHCWGKTFPKGVIATLENLDTRLSSCGIPWEVLPQTFRDAVAMTERLGFEYLWIDALCILQDSSEDWMVESARMHDVYSHCALMISADASPDSRAGLFRGSNMSYRPWPAVSGTASADGVSWKNHGVKACHGLVHGITWPALAFRLPENLYHQRPLATRAWCYQEQRLARRVLHMSVDEALWDCAGDLLKCQCGQLSHGKHEYDVFAWQRTLVEKECTRKEKESLWMNTVYNYTERDLTVWTDRLPALSGLATQFLTASKEPEPDENAKRPFKEISLGTYLAGICVSGNINWWWDDTNFQPLTEILHARCELAGSNETGSVLRGETYLRARVIPLKLYHGDLEIPGTDGIRYSYMHVQARDPSTGRFAPPSMYLPDYAPPQISSEIVLFSGADMIWGDKKTAERVDELTPLLDAEYFGLQIAANYIMVIQPALGEGPEVFERVGSIQRDWNGDVPDLTRWFEGADERTVRLV
ncbi:heterokaryon incompatibility protein-domain-containing protein [Immersiella caudata]|uniref:Heterokaryon incompatibility protein-domain-containing protein n=1 Tax=Immersiella caudata TaxID=314043 RepID=A0AA40BX47_9PEZI|nr:heterokaryon incompatibility protein-domain-containing protein [Immersiella caudata]